MNKDLVPVLLLSLPIITVFIDRNCVYVGILKGEVIKTVLPCLHVLWIRQLENKKIL